MLLIGNLAAPGGGGVGTTNRLLWALVHLALVIGAAALLLGLPAIYIRQAGVVGSTGLLGFCLLFVGFLGIGFFVPAVQAVLLPWVYDKASCTLGCHLLSTSDGPPLYVWFYEIEALATFIGLILLDWATARAATYPAWSGYLLIAAGALALPLALTNLPAVLSLVPLLLGLVGISWIGLSLISKEQL